MQFVAAIWSSLSPMWVTVPGGMTVPTRFSCRREREVDAVAIPWQKTLWMTLRTHLYTKSINS